MLGFDNYLWAYRLDEREASTHRGLCFGGHWSGHHERVVERSTGRLVTMTCRYYDDLFEHVPVWDDKGRIERFRASPASAYNKGAPAPILNHTMI